MCKFLDNLFVRLICLYLVTVLSGLLMFPGSAYSSFISSVPQHISHLDRGSVDRLQTVLEDKMIVEELSKFGFSADEVMMRLSNLSPSDRQLIVDGIHNIQVGGEGDEYLTNPSFWGGLVVVTFITYVMFAGICVITGNWFGLADSCWPLFSSEKTERRNHP